VGSSSQFCIHESWWAQGNPDAEEIMLFSALTFCCLEEGKKKKEGTINDRKQKWRICSLAVWCGSWQPQLPNFWGNFML
jgi:hypothetical protein